MKSNPFSTRFVAPGRIDWVSESSQQIDRLTHGFLFDHCSRAAIVGSHGSGKSTLLEHLVPELGTVVCKLQPGQRFSQADRTEFAVRNRTWEAIGTLSHRRIVWLQVRRQQNARRSVWDTRPLWTEHSILVIDGYEQLLPWRRLQVVLETHRERCGLLITSHRPTCLPTLCSTLVTANIARTVLEQLLPEDMPARREFLEENRLKSLLSACDGNFREVLMQLYDDYECRNLVAQEQSTACIPDLDDQSREV